MPKQKFTLFDVLNYTIFAILLFVTLFPFWQMMVITFSTPKNFLTDPYHIVPGSFSLAVLKSVLVSPNVIRGFVISIIVCSVGWLISMTLTVCGAYSLCKQDIIGRKIIFRLIIFTMYFSGGIIPLYVLVRSLNMTDTIFSLFMPCAINTFNLLLVKNYFSSVSPELEEAAQIDGYNDIQILFKVVIPVSKPVIAAVSLFYIVQYWNDFFSAMLFVSKNDLFPLALVIRNIVISRTTIVSSASQSYSETFSEQYFMALVLVAIIPVLSLYPFIQKYFTTGIMLGAVKE